MEEGGGGVLIAIYTLVEGERGAPLRGSLSRVINGKKLGGNRYRRRGTAGELGKLFKVTRGVRSKKEKRG